jgi:hypothetical protein
LLALAFVLAGANTAIADDMKMPTNTTLAECVLAAVFQGFSFGNVGTAQTAAEG